MKLNLWLLSMFMLWGAVAAAVPGDDWHYQDIVSLIAQRAEAGRPFQTVDELIDAFPEGLRRNFTFVYDTKNKFQDASPLYPRALVFNQNLVYTFNGNPTQKGYQVIELMELDEAKQKLELREITFTGEKGQPGPRYSSSTPAKCLQCHGANPRPIWSEYHHWPGIYGSNDDVLDIREKENFTRFKEKMKSDPASRYRKLVFAPAADAPFSPYKNDAVKGGYWANHINLVLTKLLTRFNAIHMVGAVHESPYYDVYKWLLPVYSSEIRCMATDDMLNTLRVQIDPLWKKWDTHAKI